MKRWPLHKAYFWEKYPFFRLLLPLVLGIWCYPAAEAQSDSFLYTVLAAVFISSAVYGVLAFRKQNEIRRIVGFVSMHVALFAIAWALCFFTDVRNDKYWFGHSVGNADSFVVQVTNNPAEKERTLKLEVDVIKSYYREEEHPVTGKGLVYVFKYGAPAIREGDVVTVSGDWLPITNRGNPFEFDYANYCARDGIYYQQFIGNNELTINYCADIQDLFWIKRVHEWCITQLDWYIKDRRVSGLLKAMLVGDRETLDDELRDAYSATGIVHIMAISGAHISIFFLLVAFLLMWIRHKKYHWVKYVAAIPLIWLYVVVAGAPASAVRAATMFSLLGVGFALQKQPNGINQLLATAFILLCADPSWLFSIGFQLSFVAVLSIFLFYRPVYKLLSPVNKVLRALWSAVAVSVAAEILVAPLVVYYFYLFPLQFIVANVLAYLFMGVILIAGMLLMALSFSYPTGRLFGEVITQLVKLFNSIVFELQEVNPVSFSRLTLTEWQLVWVYACIAFAGIGLMRKNKRMLLAASVVFVCFLAGCVISQCGDTQQHFLVVYNTGSDNYIELIEGKKATVLQKPGEVDDKVKQYVLEPAHINWHINEVDSAALPKMLAVGNTSVYILGKPVMDTLMGVDHVLLNYKAKPKELRNIKAVFPGATMVIGNNISRSQTEKLIDAATDIELPVYSIREEGAFVLSDRSKTVVDK